MLAYLRPESTLELVNRKTPTWSTLRALGSSHTVRSANIWAFVVPVIAKLLSEIEDVITIQLFGHSISIHLVLPFSWKYLFLAAISFLCANILYSIFCPRLIKETSSYKDFHDQKRSGIELRSLLNLSKYDNVEIRGHADRWISWISMRDTTIHGGKNVSTGYQPESDEKVFPEIYAFVLVTLGRKYLFVRMLTTFLYVSGFLSLAVIAIQNTIFVAQHWN